MSYKQSLAVTVTKYFLVLLFSLALSTSLARADVSLLLHEALVGASGEAGSAGHVSIYFSNICADSSIKLRPCHPGEPGVVITTYPNFGANKPYEWLAIPLLPYLYGVEEERKHSSLYQRRDTDAAARNISPALSTRHSAGQ
jgi:hypothetical protein